MQNSERRNVLIVGNGPMAVSYAKVLRDGLGFTFDVAGRNRENVRKFAQEQGAGSEFLLEELTSPILGRYDFSILTTSPDSLESIAESLVKHGAKTILVEKPAALSPAGSLRLAELMKAESVLARVAYNRRYYRSVQKLRSVLQDEKPVCAFFDFTEISRRIKAGRTQATAERWAIVNSCHVIDTIGFLLGELTLDHVHVSGANELDWHPASSTFVGAGKCGTTPVSYATSWPCPGRWNIEVMTTEGRYKLSPLERLQVVRHNSFEWQEIDADYEIDVTFKPGLMEVVRSFDRARVGGPCELPDLFENAKLASLVSRMVGYPL